MAPLLLCGFGLVFVVLRITARGVDVVPDTIGLVLYAIGLWRLAASSRVLVAASTVAGLAAVIALSFFAPDWLHGSAEDARDLIYFVASTLALVLGVFGLRARARAGHDERIARQLLVLGCVLGAVTPTLAVGYAVNGSDHDLAVGIIVTAGVLGFVAVLWFTALLLLCANREWAQPDGDRVGIPPEQTTENGPEMRETPGSRS